MPFAKLRKDKTAFIQPVLKNVHCHKGIYIDIFPLDYESKEAIFRLRKTLYTTRINQIFPNKRQSLKSKLVWIASLLLFPSYQNTLLKRELLFSSAPKNNYLTIHGGKSSEVNMPLEWFSASETCKFRDIDVTCPIGFQLYLKKIYGDDYMHHNPAKERIDNSMIEISADVLDFGKSYLEYE